MRSLFPVRAMLSTYTKFFGTSVLAAAIGLLSFSAHAEWQDPLDTPAMSTKKAPTSLLLDVTLAGDRLIAVGERGHIITSDDNGYSWTQANVPVMNTLTSVYFVNENTGWAVGHDAVVLNTQDAGLTWTKQFDGFKANEMVLAQAKKTLTKLESELSKAKVMGSASRVEDLEEIVENASYALEDAEIDFEDRSTKPLLDLWFKNSRVGYVVGAYGMIFKTVDGGQSWADWSAHVENPDRFHINSIASIDGNRLMMVGEAGLMLRTNNGGDQWEQMFSPYEGSFFGITSLTEQGVQVAYGLRGNLARTDNFGSSWRLVDTGTEQTLIGGTQRNGRQLFVIGNGGAYIKGFDFARKWESQIRDGRGNAASILETIAGHFVIVGESGVELFNKDGVRIDTPIKSL